MEHKEDNGAESRKALFNAFACCKYYKISDDGRLLSCKEIDIKYVSVDKNGNVYVDWHSANKYEQHLESAEVNIVWHAQHGYIEGIFTSKEEAFAAAEEWYKIEKQERIVELEEELARLKASI